MSITLSSVISTVRGIVIDRVDAATSTLFSDAEITSAVNSTVGGFFGTRPEAFSVSAVATEPPAMVSITVGYPQTITVSGAEVAGVNGLYDCIGMHDGKLYWANETFFIFYSVADESWYIASTLGDETTPSYVWVGADDLPGTSNWDSTPVAGDEPTVAYTLADSEIDIARWAVQQFCYGVAAFLLMQRGKDAFYREAAAQLQKLYQGR